MWNLKLIPQNFPMNLVLLFHNHQPVGQLPWTFEEVYEEAYKPFLDVLEQHPRVKVALHYTGPLLEWLIAHRPDYLRHVYALVERKQVEIIGGACYEPILAIWSHDDGQAQIARLQSRLQDAFGVLPQGFWLAERVWEPKLAPLLSSCGMRYTFVDGSLFESAGISEDKSFGSFEEASRLRVLPINKALRDKMPWHEPEETLKHLKTAQEAMGEDALCVFADDGEKFGAWPGTHAWVYKGAG
jgi:alpha-amylase